MVLLVVLQPFEPSQMYADVIKRRICTCGDPGLRLRLQSAGDCLVEKQDRRRQRHIGKDRMTAEAGTERIIYKTQTCA